MIPLESFESNTCSDNDFIININDKTCYKIESGIGKRVKIYLSPGYVNFDVEHFHKLLRRENLRGDILWKLNNTYGKDTTLRFFSFFDISDDYNYILNKL